MIIEIHNLEKLKEQTLNTRVLIDVWATWCSPCKAMSPILDDIDQEFIKLGKEIKILKIDADNEDLNFFLNQHRIRSIPTFLIYEDDKVIDTLIGALPKHKFMDFITKYFYNR